MSAGMASDSEVSTPGPSPASLQRCPPQGQVLPTSLSLGENSKLKVLNSLSPIPILLGRRPFGYKVFVYLLL